MAVCMDLLEGKLKFLYAIKQTGGDSFRVRLTVIVGVSVHGLTQWLNPVA